MHSSVINLIDTIILILEAICNAMLKCASSKVILRNSILHSMHVEAGIILHCLTPVYPWYLFSKFLGCQTVTEKLYEEKTVYPLFISLVLFKYWFIFLTKNHNSRLFIYHYHFIAILIITIPVILTHNRKKQIRKNSCKD